MEIGEQLVFNNIPYTIKDIFFRTPSSKDQRLVSISERGVMVEPGRVFYLVKSGGKDYWVKHYIDPDYGICSDANYEYNRMLKCESHNNVGPVAVYACENNMILMEYCNYEKLLNCYNGLSAANKSKVLKMIKSWIDKTQITHYDLSPNNMLVNVDGNNMDIKLIDFESTGKWHENVWDYLNEFISR